jgi:hypothetical protein
MSASHSLTAFLSHRAIRELHLKTCDDLGVEPEVRAEVEKLLSELKQLLIGISIMQDLTARAKDSLVSFGERLSTRIFASYLRQQVREREGTEHQGNSRIGSNASAVVLQASSRAAALPDALVQAVHVLEEWNGEHAYKFWF